MEDKKPYSEIKPIFDHVEALERERAAFLEKYPELESLLCSQEMTCPFCFQGGTVVKLFYIHFDRPVRCKYCRTFFRPARVISGEAQKPEALTGYDYKPGEWDPAIKAGAGRKQK